MKPSVLFSAIKSELAEGPMWHPSQKLLYWVDILQKRVFNLNIENLSHKVYQFEHMPSAVVPTQNNNLLIISFDNGIALFDTKTEKITYLLKYHENEPHLRANDGKCDPFGNFWIGTMDRNCTDKAGALYCLRPNGIFEKKLDNITISNGLCWSPDHRTMYYIDTFYYAIRAFEVDNKGNMTHERIVIDGTKEGLGYLDGMTIDTEGMLWVAHFNGGSIRRWNPNTGKELLKIDLPVPKVTSLTFGGKNYKTLFITTAQENMTALELEKYPLSGSIFYIETDYQGFETHRFIVN